MTTSPQELKAHVLDPTQMDVTVRPQDDFYRYINGTWLRDHKIPSDRASDGAFHALRDQSEERCKTIAEEAAAGQIVGTEAERIGILYDQFMDVETLNALGTTPISPLLEAISAAANHDELAGLTGTLSRYGVSPYFGVGVWADLNDPDRYTMNFEQGGLGLPDESYYTGDEYAEYRSKYVEHVGRALILAKVVPAPLATEAATEVMEFETELASHHWDVVKSREVEAQNNPRTWTQVIREDPGFNWSAWEEGLAVKVEGKHLNVSQPDYLAAAAQLWKKTHLHTLKLWLARRVIDAFSPYLSEEMAEETFDFYGRTLSGIEEMRPRWKRALSLVEEVVGFDLGRLYVERYFPAEYKERMDVLVRNLLDACGQSIRDLDWMGEETKQKALEKLGTFQPKIGYPDNPRDYNGLEITRSNTLVENLIASSQFDFEWEFSKLGTPVDRTEWLMTPQTVNAYYYPTMNEIVFPAAILQPPFFNPDADDAVNYGAIGAVIGHEIGHGFDDQGSQFDATGAVNNWWTDKDRKEFEQRTAALIEQYNKFSPADLDDTNKVNGALTIGENIGDLGGLSIAWKAWKKAQQDAAASGADDDKEIDGLTPAQRFFISWARIWRSKSRSDYAIQLLAIDPHSPTEFRCNGVLANFDQFAEEYDLTPEDGLWVAPEDRVRIW